MMRGGGRSRPGGRYGWGLVAALLATAGAAAGCAGADDGDTAPPEMAPPTEGSGTPLSLVGVVPGARGGPVSEALGWTGTPQPPPDVAAELSRERDRQNAIAGCMTAAGFEYWPAIPRPEQVEVVAGAPAPGTVEFATRWGYGIWNQPESGTDGIGWTLEAPPAELAYLASLSESARAAYDEALYGPVVEETEDGWIREGGCLDQAGGGLARQDPRRESLQEAIDFLLALPASSAFDELNATWASCLRTAGYRDASPLAAQQRIGTEYQQRQQEAEGTGLAQETVRQQQANEIELALADLACQTEVGYVDAYDLIDRAEQEAYAAQHAAELATLAQWVSGESD